MRRNARWLLRPAVLAKHQGCTKQGYNAFAYVFASGKSTGFKIPWNHKVEMPADAEMTQLTGPASRQNLIIELSLNNA